MVSPACKSGISGESSVRREQDTCEDHGKVVPPGQGGQDGWGNEDRLGESVPLWAVGRVEPQLEVMHVQASKQCDHGAGIHMARRE